MTLTRAPLAILVVMLAGHPAQAEPDTFGVGNGQSGPLLVPTATATTINTCWTLQGGAVAGASTVVVAGSGQLASGTLVMFHQTTGVPDPMAPDASVLDYSGSSVGRWELARVANHAGTSLTLTAPLVAPFNPNGAQVIEVPEYTTVTVEPYATVMAPPWDGSCGGVLAFLASSTATIDGTISADHAGFRGGPSAGVNNTGGCTTPNQSPPMAGPKGEGLVPGQFGPTSGGWGSVTSGGGGGDCQNAGGGGGGNGGMGGRGGHTNGSDGARLVGGHGGASILVSSNVDQLLLGGGGGAGHTDEVQSPNGANGGGAILIRAQALVGVGQFNSDGQSAPPTGGNCVGAGGGGAGGSIALSSMSNLGCAWVSARGGTGGGTVNCSDTGPGGGGAGGRVFLTGTSIVCAPTVEGGVAGTIEDGGNNAAGPTLTQRTAGAGRGVITRVVVPSDGGGGADAGCGLVAQVGCDCGSGGGAGWWALGLGAAAVSFRRVRARRAMPGPNRAH